MDILLRKLRSIDNSRSAYNDVPLFTSYYALLITDIVTSLFHTYACHSVILTGVSDPLSVVLTGVSDPPQCGTDRGEWSPSMWYWQGWVIPLSVVLTGVSDPPQCGTDMGEWSPSVWYWHGWVIPLNVVLTGVSDPPQCGTDRGEWSPSVLHSEVIRIWKWNGLERGYTITLVHTLLFFSCGGISLLDSLSSVWEHGIVEYHYTCFISVYKYSWFNWRQKGGIKFSTAFTPY